MILRIAVVTEANYLDLKKLCQTDVVGKDFADFLRLIDQTLEHAKLLQIDTVRVNIDPVKFAHWIGARKAKRLDLLRYADMVHRNPLNHDEAKISTGSPHDEKERPSTARR